MTIPEVVAGVRYATQSGARLLVHITNGSVVQVRGLLFLEGGAFRLVAGRIGVG